MAFVTIDNPSGILQHGGQMAWDAISDTRVAMVTITADYKALIQEINQVDGAPVVGTPSFIAQLPTSGLQPWYHMRPKIKSMGNGRVFVMVPISWAAPDAFARPFGWGSQLSTIEQNLANVRMPSRYACYVMERNASGQYTAKSVVNVDATAVTGTTYTSSVHFALNITSVSDTSIVITRAARQISTSTNSFINNWRITIPVADGVLGTPVFVLISHQYVSALPSNCQAFDIKTVQDKQGNDVELYAIAGSGTSFFEYGAERAIWRQPITNVLYAACYLLAGTTGYVAYTNKKSPALYYLSLNGIVAPDVNAQGDYYATGGQTADSAVAYNGNSLAMNSILVYPLDSAYVTSDGVVCAVGGRSSGLFARTVFDGDLAVHLYQSLSALNVVDTVVPLQLSFRQPTNIGQYVGPFDPLTLPYFYKERMNNSKILHKVDDTHFWLIGCFMENSGATPKLGVISVSV